MDCKFQIARNGIVKKEHIKNTEVAKFEVPGIKEYLKFIQLFEFSKGFRGFVWKMLLETKAFLSNSFFHTNLLIFLKNSDHYKISISLDRALKLGHFDIFDMLFPFLAFAQ